MPPVYHKEESVMKKAIVCALVAAVSWAAMADPFGLSMGMSLEDVAAACGGRDPVAIGGGRYIVTPQEANPLFSECIAWISESEGLCAIRVNGEDILLSDSGDEIRLEFSAVQERLEALYGEAMLSEGADVPLQADWLPESGDVEWVCLVAEGSGSSSYLFVQYTFTNFQSAMEQSCEAQADDGVF